MLIAASEGKLLPLFDDCCPAHKPNCLRSASADALDFPSRMARSLARINAATPTNERRAANRLRPEHFVRHGLALDQTFEDLPNYFVRWRPKHGIDDATTIGASSARLAPADRSAPQKIEKPMSRASTDNFWPISARAGSMLGCAGPRCRAQTSRGSRACQSMRFLDSDHYRGLRHPARCCPSPISERLIR